MNPSEWLVFNGVDAETGGYRFPPAPLVEVAESIRRTTSTGGAHAADLAHRDQSDEAHLGVMAGFRPEDLASVGWAIVVPEGLHADVLESLRPLRDLRREQAGNLYRELVRRTNEDVDDWLDRHEMSPGPCDPRKIPYYVLLVGDPEAIPFEFQYQLDVDYAVGRICFETLAEYAAYAETVEKAESETPPTMHAHLFGPRNPADEATALSAELLLTPLREELAELLPASSVAADIGQSATQSTLIELLTGDRAPALLFTASHGLATQGPDQRARQGALVCQEWPGPFRRGPVGEDCYVSGAHVAGTRIRTRIVMSFACYSAGTPAGIDDSADNMHETSFVAGLPQCLLGTQNGGALAFVGHVDRALGYSFMWTGVDPHITAMASTVVGLLGGSRVGSAMESLNSRYASIATRLDRRLTELRGPARRQINDSTVTQLWAAAHDARNYVVIGDPAVRAIPPQ
ncbi:hypothetical protein P3H15_42535 [Rhodococcus sp. T2V]|uniref:hypothetical protein n=1 Tax=Rhodococcus sp. T2V TaxID=3034164 RepID=UPI0023E1CD4A|nr:hypothetical protein [Rhodococcus sp. T2V]MDF3311661.1 hypothetical protein [Rhodococcus sp. T2V]